MPLLLRVYQSGCTEALSNGSFQSGALSPWFSVGDAGLGTGRDSTYGGWLGGKNNAQGELDQWVTLPAVPGPIRWEFWWKAETSAAQPDDLVYVRIEVEGSEPHLLTLRAEGALNTWRQDSVDLTPYAGKTLLASFLVLTDAATPTTFRNDDVSIRLCSGG